MRTKIRGLAEAGLIAAAYVVLTVVIQPIGYGTVQFRASEMLTVLPVFTPAAIPGLAIGCFLSNLIGLSSGANPAGAWDLLIGTAATLVAAVMTYYLRNIRVRKLPLLAVIPPIVVNAAAIGAELSVVFGAIPWYWHVLGVALGQFVTCGIGGVLLAVALDRVKRL